MLEIAFLPDPDRREPIHRQLSSYLRGLIETGRLQDGEKLPASRELATALSLSRNTVNRAYQTLVDAQLARAHVGQGTFVAAAAGLPRTAPPDAAIRQEPREERRRALVWDGLLSRRGEALPRWEGRHAIRRDARFDFLPGRTSVEGLSLESAYRRAAATVAEFGNDFEFQGWPPLREHIARNLLARGVRCEPQDILITAGAQQALDLIARVLVDPGDVVAIEQPGYFNATACFRAAGARLVGVPVDAGGLRVDLLARLLRQRRVKLAYLTPAVQCPTGVTLDDERRDQLLDLSEGTQTPLIDDDYDGELRTFGPAVPALKTLDRAGLVTYVGTFSKSLFPALRLGYVLAPAPLLERLVAAKATSDLGSSLVDQVALAEAFSTGELERHLRRMRQRYAHRIDVALDVLEDAMPETTHVHRPAAGNTLWLTLPPDIEPRELRARCRAADLEILTHEPFYLSRPDRTSILLSVAHLEESELREGLQRLAECVWQQLRSVDSPAAGSLRQPGESSPSSTSRSPGDSYDS